MKCDVLWPIEIESSSSAAGSTIDSNGTDNYYLLEGKLDRFAC